MTRTSQNGFTLLEMILVVVITGIIGGIVATFLLMPVRGYTDLARRAELADIADTALRRMSRDIRTALPNSVRIATNGANTYLEFLPTKGSGRYRVGVVNPGDDPLDFTTADTAFNVLGPMPPLAAGDSIVIYNRGITGADVYAGDNRSGYVSNTATTITINSKLFPFRSPGNRFQVIDTPVTYVCAPATDAAGNGTGTLSRWQGYAIQSAVSVALPAGGSTALLASKVSACTLSYGAVGQRLGLVTLQLTLVDGGEGVTLYSSTHVSNVP